jgi:hypothetical protein
MRIRCPHPDVLEQTPSGAGERRSSPHCRRTEQRLTLLIETAFSGNEGRIVQAGIIERTVPAPSLAPFAPGDVVAILAVGISGFSGCTKKALAGMGGSGDEVPRHHGGRERGKKGSGSAKKSEFCHVFLPQFQANVKPKCTCEIPPAVPKRYLKLRGLSQPSAATRGRKPVPAGAGADARPVARCGAVAHQAWRTLLGGRGDRIRRRRAAVGFAAISSDGGGGEGRVQPRALTHLPSTR